MKHCAVLAQPPKMVQSGVAFITITLVLSNRLICYMKTKMLHESNTVSFAVLNCSCVTTQANNITDMLLCCMQYCKVRHVLCDVNNNWSIDVGYNACLF